MTMQQAAQIDRLREEMKRLTPTERIGGIQELREAFRELDTRAAILEITPHDSVSMAEASVGVGHTDVCATQMCAGTATDLTHYRGRRP